MAHKILAASWNFGSSNSIIPVVRNLESNGDYDVIVLADDESRGNFEKNGITYVEANPTDVADIAKKDNYDLILTGTSTPNKEKEVSIEQVLTSLGAEENIPVVSVQDMWGLWGQKFADYSSPDKIKYKPTKLCVLDNLAHDAMRRLGFQNLVITGNPHFDNLGKMRDDFNERDQVRIDIGMGVDSTVIMYAAIPIEYHYGNSKDENEKYMGYTEKDSLAHIIEELNNHGRNDVDLVVSLHPRQKDEKQKFVDLAGNYRGVSVVIDHEHKRNSKEIALASDIVMDSFSTMLVETTILDKPSVSYQPNLLQYRKPEEDVLIGTNSTRVTLPVYTREELTETMTKLLNDEEFLKELAENRKKMNCDGKATERVVEVVNSML